MAWLEAKIRLLPIVFLTLEPDIKMPSPCNSTKQKQLHYSVTPMTLCALPTIVPYKNFTADPVLVIYKKHLRIQKESNCLFCYLHLNPSTMKAKLKS